MASCQPPSLTFCGVDVVNPARTVSYIQNGLGPVGLDVNGQVAAGAFIVDGGAVASYSAPDADPAPWYDSARPESAEFLGFLPAGVTGYDGSPLVRQVDQRGGYLQGGSWSTQQRTPRQHVWTGQLVARSQAGIDYGQRWLSGILGAACSDCEVCDSAVRLWPPDDPAFWEDGRWVEYEVAVAAGVNVDLSGGLVCPAQFTVTAGNPYLYKEPLSVLDAVAVATPIPAGGGCLDFPTWWCGVVASDDVCIAIDAPTSGILSPIVTFDATSGGTDAIHVLLYDDCPGGSPDPSQPPRGLRIPVLPDGWTVTIDSSRGTINGTNASGDAVNASSLVEAIDGGYPFLSVEDCDATKCICIGVDKPCAANPDTTVSVLVQRRNR